VPPPEETPAAPSSLPSPRTLFRSRPDQVEVTAGAHGHGQQEQTEQVRRPKGRPKDVWLGPETPAARSTHVDMLDREIRKLEEQMDQLRSGGRQLVLMAAERARLSTLQRQHQSYLAQRNQHILHDIRQKFSDVLADFGQRMLAPALARTSSSDIRSALNSDPDHSELWGQLAALSDCGRPHLRREIEDTMDELRKIEGKQVAELKREMELAAKQQALLDQEDHLAEEDEEPEDTTALDMERMQHNIDRLQQLLSVDSSTAQENAGVHETALNAALYLKKTMSKLSAEIEESDRNVVDVASSMVKVAEPVADKELPDKEPTGKGWLEFEVSDARGRVEFVGELFHDCEHGLGTMTWVDGTKYKGEFYDGYTHGFGHEIYSDSTSYKGQFHKNLRNGMGVHMSVNGEHFSGEWMGGERHGRGIVSKVSQGQLKAVLAAFDHGNLLEILHDDAIYNDIRDRVQQAVRRAMETVTIPFTIVQARHAWACGMCHLGSALLCLQLPFFCAHRVAVASDQRKWLC
jgi:hypothetical protein